MSEYSDRKTEKIDCIPGIECTVTNCIYNDNKKNCYANKIQVGPMHAEREEETECATFKQKPSDSEI